MGRADVFIDYKSQDYVDVLHDVDGVLDSLGERNIEASVDGVFGLGDVNAALAKVAAGGSKGKTALRLN